MKIFFLPLFILIGYTIQAQVFENPVTWTQSIKKIDDKIYVIQYHATIATEGHWHIYSANIDPSIGPYPTKAYFDDIKGYKLIGELQEEKPIIEYDKAFMAELGYFEETAMFEQKVQLTSNKAMIYTEIEWMVCNGETCLPPQTQKFVIELPTQE